MCVIQMATNPFSVTDSSHDLHSCSRNVPVPTVKTLLFFPNVSSTPLFGGPKELHDFIYFVIFKQVS